MTASDSGVAADKVHYAQAISASKKISEKVLTTREQIQSDDEMRLSKCGYKQETKRIFGLWSNFGLAASMISVILGVIPLYTYSLANGGPAVMLWSWIVIGFVTLILVTSLAEICCAYPTMGALYYWAYRLGGDEWGPFASWMAGWCNLLGQIAGVASGGYSGAEVIGDISTLTSGVVFTPVQLLAVYAMVLIFAGIINTFAEQLLTRLCSISVVWHIVGVIVIVALMVQFAPTLKSAEYVAVHFNNGTPFRSPAYVVLTGSLAAASTFTGYDTAAHVAEETSNSHYSSPIAMIGSVVNCIFLGILLITGLNYCIQDINSLIDPANSYSAYTILWLQTVGPNLTIFFEIITFVAIECSNCANLTSASRMIYSLSRDGAIPLSSFWYNMDSWVGGPVRSIWLSCLLAFILGTPGLTNPTVLGALFSLTATGLYSSYLIPILLRVTVSRNSFQPAEFNLGKYSIFIGWISILWCLFMIIVLCLPQDTPITINNMNYSPIALGIVLVGAWFSWVVSARFWFKGMKCYTDTNDTETSSEAEGGSRSRTPSSEGLRSRATSEEAVEEGNAVSSDKTMDEGGSSSKKAVVEGRFEPIL